MHIYYIHQQMLTQRQWSRAHSEWNSNAAFPRTEEKSSVFSSKSSDDS